MDGADPGRGDRGRQDRGRLHRATAAVAVAAAVALVAAGGGSRGTAPLPVVRTTVTSAAERPWRTVWSDEFDGTAVDPVRWEVEHSTFGDGNRELQCYRPENATVDGGLLVLEARRGTNECRHGRQRAFSSGMLRSRAAWAYGAFEARVRVPRGAGMLPAFWLLPDRYPYGRAGRSGELDVVEVDTADPSTALVTAHWSHEPCGWGCRRYGREVRLRGPDAATGFHTYRLEWEPGRLLWLVDGDPVYELGEQGWARWSSAAATPAPGSATYPAPFDGRNPMYLLVNLAVGGDTPGTPPAGTSFPARMEVDRVVVQQR